VRQCARQCVAVLMAVCGGCPAVCVAVCGCKAVRYCAAVRQCAAVYIFSNKFNIDSYILFV
jgi:ribosomal protein S12